MVWTRIASPSPPCYDHAAGAHDPEKLLLDLIGDVYRFSDKIMRKQNAGLGKDS
jgi:hypothetical protein